MPRSPTYWLLRRLVGLLARGTTASATSSRPFSATRSRCCPDRGAGDSDCGPGTGRSWPRRGCSLRRGRWSCFLVDPDTLGRWHRQFVRRRPPRRHGKPGRPSLRSETSTLVVRLGRENLGWGYMRIRGELKKLGIEVSATTIATLLRRSGLGPAPRKDRSDLITVPPGGGPRPARRGGTLDDGDEASESLGVGVEPAVMDQVPPACDRVPDVRTLSVRGQRIEGARRIGPQQDRPSRAGCSSSFLGG